MIRGFKGLPIMLRSFYLFKKLNQSSASKMDMSFNYPMHADYYAQSGVAQDHYLHQDLLAAQKIFKQNPDRYVNVGSRLAGPVSHVAASRPIKAFDIRPQTAAIPNIIFEQADLMSDDSSLDGICDSLSYLHALEHFGLGRYNDPVDSDGHIKGLQNLTKLLSSGGTFYLSVPIGPERVEYNAHRVFNPQTIIDLCTPGLKLFSFHYADDNGDLQSSTPRRGHHY
ncbi:MAG: DUF268 domain-containing protein [Okeania sp. SIO3B3]|nr:DUF268 domain-containing protein [Okeania sp. SIO3B3]